VRSEDESNAPKLPRECCGPDDRVAIRVCMYYLRVGPEYLCEKRRGRCQAEPFGDQGDEEVLE